MTNILKIRDKITGAHKAWRPHMANLKNSTNNSSHLKETHEMNVTERKQAEKEFQTIIKTALDGFWLTNLDGKLLEVNDSYCKMVGYTREELLEMSIPDIEAIESSEEIAQHIKRVIEQGYDRFETRHKCKDGRIIDVEISANYLDVGEGQFFAFARDITKQKKAEEELANEVIQRRILMEQSRDGIVILDQNGKAYEANRQFAEILGYSSEEVLQLHVWDWDTQFTHEQLLDMIHDIDEAGDHFETYWRRKDGTLCDVEISTNGAVFEGQKLVFCVCRDITERKKAEEVLRIKESAIASSINGIAMADIEGNLTYVNDSFLKMWGYDDEQRVLGKPAIEFWQSKDKASEVVEALNDRGNWIGELVGMKEDGSSFDIQLSASMVKDEAGKPICMMAAFVDITERKKIEEQMFRLSSAVSMSTDYIMITDFDAKIIDINQKTLEMYGADSKEELIGRHFLELVAPAQRAMVSMDVREIIEKGYLESREYHIISKNGREIPMQVSSSLVKAADGEPLGLVRVGRELSKLS